MVHILDTGVASAEENMACDVKLLEEMQPQDSPILHFYQWATPAATFGHFIAPEKYLDLEQVKKYRLALARRPTGGGIVFHIWDFAFSFLMPAFHPAFSLNTLENYRFVNQIVLEAMSSLFSLSESPQLFGCATNLPSSHFCMAKPTPYDVVCRGMKIAGAAQRKQRQGYLHQGTLSLAFPCAGFLADLLLEKKMLHAILAHTFAPLGRLWEGKALREARSALQRRLIEKFVEKLELSS